MIDSTEQMTQATFLARSGEQDRARYMFTQIVEQDPSNFQAWLWLSELSSDLEEQTAHLEQAMKWAPGGAGGGKDLQAHLNELRGCIALSAPALVATAPAVLPAVPEIPPHQELDLPAAGHEPIEAQWRNALFETQPEFSASPPRPERGSRILDLARSLFLHLF